ncbi:MAG TPA: ribonuclease H-like domain-containing protein [Candidatus Paceibacterota bacterium]|nr:ribonuclease H-like domain-containing protein [Candidatus Paceibacterota bacterium]
MATLVFDIETVAKPWELFSETVHHALLRNAHTDEDRMRVKERLPLSPFTGEIVALSMYDVERKKGIVYAVDIEDGYEYGDFTWHRRTEKEMLEDFWEGATHYDTFVTYNGRMFDVPYLSLRSAMCGVRPRIEITKKRFLSQQTGVFHVDLLDQCTWYGALSRWPSLRLACDAFGVGYDNEQVSGEDIAELFRMKKFRDIAHHAMSDTIATYKLYERWYTYLAPTMFIQRYEHMP